MNRMKTRPQDEEEGNLFQMFGRNRNRGGGLATTCIQFREQKRATHRDSACRIQNMIRKTIKCKLLPTKKNNNQISRLSSFLPLKHCMSIVFSLCIACMIIIIEKYDQEQEHVNIDGAKKTLFIQVALTLFNKKN